jgi:hypothetical protein
MTPVYFKATKPTGASFVDSSVIYEVGRIIRPAKTTELARICGPGFLHASDEPGEVLAGGSWPCRLFEVTGKPRAGFDSSHRHKGGFRQLKVVREIDPYLALGPNGRYVAGIIERTRKVDREEIEKLQAAWVAAWGAARGAAWGAAWEAARQAAWGAAWVAAREAAWEAARGALWGATRVAAWVAAWEAMREAAREATRGALMRDQLTPEQYKILTGPWVSVMGPIRMAPKWRGPS